mmetsp:Transcript_11476/g.23493  ORF Transcript_11476/g.23493 Transcript_11476/m.23493 type:complete len:242 (+) Transcript_11476:672-1397(+)
MTALAMLSLASPSFSSRLPPSPTSFIASLSDMSADSYQTFQTSSLLMTLLALSTMSLQPPNSSPILKAPNQSGPYLGISSNPLTTILSALSLKPDLSSALNASKYIGPYHGTCAIKYLNTFLATVILPALLSSIAPSSTVLQTFVLSSFLSLLISPLAPSRSPCFSRCLIPLTRRPSLSSQWSRPSMRTSPATSPLPCSSSSLLHSSQAVAHFGFASTTAISSLLDSSHSFPLLARSASSR